MDKAEWLEYRKSGIGGSDTASVLGVNPYQTRRELALYKLGITPSQPDNPAMARGRALEPIIADLFTERTGIELIESNLSIRHPEHPHMLASFDRLTKDKDTVVEIKCPGLNVFGKAKREGLPLYWITQLQHYMTFPGVKRGIFVIFNAERWEMLHFEHEPDSDLQAQIIGETRRFWEDLQRGIIPEDSQPVIDMPSAGHAEVFKISSREFEQAAEELREAQAIRKEAEELETQAKERIVTLMGDYGIAENDMARIYNRFQNGRTTFDLKRFKKDFPNIDFSKYEKTGKPFKTFRAFFFRGE